MTLAKNSIALLVIQLAIVSAIAGKYLYERWRCPRVWARTVVFDPSLPMRGRYFALHLSVDGCASNPPFSAPRQPSGSLVVAPNRMPWNGIGQVFPAKLFVRDNKLAAARIPDEKSSASDLEVGSAPGASCDNLTLNDPVSFYVPEQVITTTSTSPGHELWIEVTVPSKGPPRPIQLARKDDGVWKPLAFE
jgi:hypothetical protein